MKYISVLFVVCLAWQVYLANCDGFWDLELRPIYEQAASTEKIVDAGPDFTENYPTILDAKTGLSETVDVGEVRCKTNAENVTKLEQEVRAFRSKIVADARKMQKLKEIVAVYEAQIDSYVASLAEQTEQIGYLNNTIAYYKSSCTSKDSQITELLVRAEADASRLKQKEDQIADFKEKLVKADASSCLAYGSSTAIQILNLPGISPFLAPCESRHNGIGWTVIQRRLDGSVNFNRNWNDYKNGFGNLDGEFFIGLEKLHRMTAAQPHELLIYMETFDLTGKDYKFSLFAIGSEEEDYKLTVKNYNNDYNQHPLIKVNGQKFSTYDRDNDNFWLKNCAQELKSGWWFDSCRNTNDFSNLNGEYKSYVNPRESIKFNGIIWHNMYGSHIMKTVQMMIRPITE